MFNGDVVTIHFKFDSEIPFSQKIAAVWALESQLNCGNWPESNFHAARGVGFIFMNMRLGCLGGQACHANRIQNLTWLSLANITSVLFKARCSPFDIKLIYISNMNRQPTAQNSVYFWSVVLRTLFECYIQVLFFHTYITIWLKSSDLQCTNSLKFLKMS